MSAARTSDKQSQWYAGHGFVSECPHLLCGLLCIPCLPSLISAGIFSLLSVVERVHATGSGGPVGCGVGVGMSSGRGSPSGISGGIGSVLPGSGGTCDG